MYLAGTRLYVAPVAIGQKRKSSTLVFLIEVVPSWWRKKESALIVLTSFVIVVGGSRTTPLQWIAEGKIKTKETIVKGGITVTDTAFGRLFTGDKLGKLYVEVKAP